MLEEVKEHAQENKYSCVHHPLLHIPLEDVVVDELYPILRVTVDGLPHEYQSV